MARQYSSGSLKETCQLAFRSVKRYDEFFFVTCNYAGYQVRRKLDSSDREYYLVEINGDVRHIKYNWEDGIFEPAPFGDGNLVKTIATD